MKKIKGMSKAVRMKYLMYLFAVSLVAMLPIRLYQLLGLIELDTGFFSETNFTVVLVYVLALAVPLLFIVLSYISKEVPSPMLPVGKNYALGISSLVFSAALLYDAVINAFHIIPSTAGTIGIVLDVIKSNLSESGGMFLLARIVFAFLGCVWFLVFAVSHLGGNTAYKNYKLLALAPVCWAASRLVTYLTSPISFVNITELMFELYMLMFLTLFLITSARISTGVFSEDGMWGIYGFGLSAAFFGAVVTIPRAVVLIIGRENVQGYSFEPADLGALIFAISYIFASFGIGFDGATQSRRLVSEVVLPEDGVVVKKSADREEVTVESAPASSEEETHGIFKVEDEIIENAPPRATAELEKESAPELVFEESAKVEANKLFEAAEEISAMPEEPEAFSGEEETDYGELLKGFEETSEVAEKSSADKALDAPEKPVKKSTPEKVTVDKKQDDAHDFSAEELFADSGEDEEAGETENKKRSKASKKSKLDKLRETAESADEENALKEAKNEEKAKASTDKKAKKAELKAQKEAAKKEKAEKAALEKANKAAAKEAEKAQRKAQAEKAALEKAEKAALLKAEKEAEKAQKEKKEKAAQNKKTEPEKKNVKNGEKSGKKAKESAAKSSNSKEKAKVSSEKKNKKEAQKSKGNASEKKPEKKKEQKSGGLFGKKEKEPEEEVISTVSLKDMKNNRKN